MSHLHRLDKEKAAELRYESAYAVENLLTRNVYVLRWVFAWLVDEKDVAKVYRVCRFWRRMSCWANPLQRFLDAERAEHARALWRFSGEWIPPALNVLQAAVKHGVYDAVDTLIDHPLVVAEYHRSPQVLLLTAVEYAGCGNVLRRLLRSALCDTTYDLMRAFFRACTSDRPDLALILLDHSVFCETFIDEGNFSWLCKYGEYSVIKRVVRNCAAGRYFATPDALLCAVTHGRYAIVDLLLEQPGMQTEGSIEAALTNAAANGSYYIVRRLLRTPGQSLRFNVHAVYAAAAYGHVDILTALLAPERGSAAELGALAASAHCAAAFAAAMCNHDATLRVLLAVPTVRNTLRVWRRRGVAKYAVRDTVYRSRTRPPETSMTGSQVFHSVLEFDQQAQDHAPERYVPDLLTAASMSGAIDVVAMLLRDEYADLVARRAHECMPLVMATTFNHWNVVELLLGDTRIDPSVNNQFVLIEAIGARCVGIVRRLLADPRRRVNPNARWGLPLQTAARVGDDGIVDVLLACPSVDPGYRKNQCVAIALENGHLGVALKLARDRRVVNVSYDSNHLLRTACRFNCAELVGVLLSKKGADATVNNNEPLRSAVCLAAYDVQLVLLRNRRSIVDPSYSRNSALEILCETVSAPAHVVREFLNHPRTVVDEELFARLVLRAANAQNLEVLEYLLVGHERFALSQNMPELLAVLRHMYERSKLVTLRYLVNDPRFFTVDAVLNALPDFGNPMTEASLFELLACERIRAAICLQGLMRSALHRRNSDLARWIFAQPRFNPAADNNALMILAAENGMCNVLALFVDDPRVDILASADALLARAAKWSGAPTLLLHAIHARARERGDVVREARTLQLISELPKQWLGVANHAWVHAPEPNVSAEFFEASDDEGDETTSEELVVPEPPTARRDEPANKRRRT